MKLILKGARIIDPAQKRDGVGDILIEDGHILAIGDVLEDAAARVMDASGLCAAPGLIDMHVHLRDPGQTHKEDIFTGANAAAAGGFTAVCCMPNTSPVIDSTETLDYIVEKASRANTRVYPVAAATAGLRGEQLTDYAALRAHGAVAVSDDGRPVEDADMLASVLRKAQEAGLIYISHCEDLKIIDGGIIHKGAVSERLGVKGMDRLSEDSITERELLLAERAGCRVHIAHVSTAGSVALIRAAKARGVQVTAETAAHYLLLTHESLLARDANFRMNPPLREESDRLAVIAGVLDGTLDAIASDHAPHSQQEKAVFETAPNGITGLETSFAACMTALVHGCKMPLPTLIERMSATPARLLGLPGGTLRPGAPADIVLFDPQAEWVFDKARSFSKSRNTPFHGMKLKGRVLHTILEGKFVYSYKSKA